MSNTNKNHKRTLELARQSKSRWADTVHGKSGVHTPKHLKRKHLDREARRAIRGDD